MIELIRCDLIKLLTCLLLFCGIAFGQTKPSEPPASEGKVLPLIEKYKAPSYPRTQYLDRETYDYRISSHRPVPETLTDVFICDVWQRVEMDLKLKISPQEVSEDVIKQSFDIYLQKKYEDIAGYRPWTHWNFIRSLKPSQRGALVVEVTEYIRKNGVRDRDEKTEQKQ